MIKVENRDGIDIINIETDMSKENVKEFEEIFDEVLAKKSKKVIINFKNVNFIVSQILGIIIIKTKRIRENNGEIKIVNSNPYIERLLSIIGIGKIIDVLPSLDEAVEDF
ncbi:MAG: STAS domain-containing protein [Candidatus Muiribacteriota bacterium]